MKATIGLREGQQRCKHGLYARARSRQQRNRRETLLTHEMIQAKLNRQCCLSHTTITQHHQLVDHHFAAHVGRLWRCARVLLCVMQTDGRDGVTQKARRYVDRQCCCDACRVTVVAQRGVLFVFHVSLVDSSEARAFLPTSARFER